MSQFDINFVPQQKIVKMENVNIKPFQVIGIMVKTTNENGKAANDITDLWGRFIKEEVLDKIPNKIDNTVYSLYTDYEGDHTKPYTTILGCKVKNLNTIPVGMVGKAFSGGNYMKLTAKGDLTKGLIINKWSQIWGMDLERLFTVDFEVFGEKAKNPLDAEIDFLIAVK